MNTPIRASWAVISFSEGYSFSLTSVPRALDNRDNAFDAAPLAWMTVSGISFGSVNGPATNIPSLDELTGENEPVLQKLYSFNDIPKVPEICFADFGASNPVERTIMSYSRVSFLSLSDRSLMIRFLVWG